MSATRAGASTAAANALGRLVVRTRRQIELVEPASVDWIGADGNYVLLHVGDRVLRRRGSLGDLELALDPRRFLRIHRSVIVNVERVAQVLLDRASDCTLVLLSGERFRVGRRHRARLAPLLDGRL